MNKTLSSGCGKKRTRSFKPFFRKERRSILSQSRIWNRFPSATLVLYFGKRFFLWSNLSGQLFTSVSCLNFPGFLVKEDWENSFERDFRAIAYFRFEVDNQKLLKLLLILFSLRYLTTLKVEWNRNRGKRLGEIKRLQESEIALSHSTELHFREI